MRKRQARILLGIYATSIALAAILVGALWLRQSDTFTLNSVGGPRSQGDVLLQGVRFLPGHEAPKPVAPPPLWLQAIYALVRHEWNCPITTQYPALEITTSTPVRGGEQLFIQDGPVLPIVEYTATATTPGGRKFPLMVGLENPPHVWGPNVNLPAPAPKSNVFYVMFPEKVPGTFHYLDVTLTGRGKTATWRVRNLPKWPRQVAPPRQPTATAKGDGVAVEIVAWFLPDGKEEKLWMHWGKIVPPKRVPGQDPFAPNAPPVPGATLHTLRVEQDAIQLACLVNYTRAALPSPPPARADGFPVPAVDVLDDCQLIAEQIELEWGSEPVTPVGMGKQSRVMSLGTGPAAPVTVDATLQPRILAQAFGGEQGWARITARLDRAENSVAPVVFTDIPVQRTPQGPRLNVGDGLTVTTAEGVRVTVSDPNRTAKKRQVAPRGRTRQPSYQMTYSPSISEIPVRIDWTLPGAKLGDFDTKHLSNPEILWRDSAGKWQAARGIPGPYTRGDTEGYFVCTIPRSVGKRIRALGLSVRLGRRFKSTPLSFTVPIQSGLPPNLPQ